MKSNITKILLSGIAGTLMMSLMVKFAAPMLGNMMGVVYALRQPFTLCQASQYFHLFMSFYYASFFQKRHQLKIYCSALVYGDLLGILQGNLLVIVMPANAWLKSTYV